MGKNHASQYANFGSLRVKAENRMVTDYQYPKTLFYIMSIQVLFCNIIYLKFIYGFITSILQA